MPSFFYHIRYRRYLNHFHDFKCELLLKLKTMFTINKGYVKIHANFDVQFILSSVILRWVFSDILSFDVQSFYVQSFDVPSLDVQSFYVESFNV